MTHPAWRKHLRDSLCIFSHEIALPRTAEVRSVFLSPDMTSARCTYVISTTCLTLVLCLKPTRQLHSAMLSIQITVVTQLQPWLLGLGLLWMQKAGSQGGQSIILSEALGAQTHNLGQDKKPDPGSGLQTKASSGQQDKTVNPVTLPVLLK